MGVFVAASGAAVLTPGGGNPWGDRPPIPAVAELVVRVSPAGGFAAEPPLVASAARQTAVRFEGRPQTTVFWEFGYRGLSLGHGVLVLNEAGSGRLRFVPPDVRHRTVFELLLASDGAVARQTVVIYPSLLLRDSARCVRESRIGVCDAAGRVREALRMEGVTCEDLAPQIARDYFDGNMAILAGYSDAEALIDVCRRLDSRVKGGMGVLVLNPPAGWSAWGLNCRELQWPARGPICLAAPAGVFVKAEDLGEGPWRTVLDIGPDASVMARCEAVARPTAGMGIKDGDVKTRPVLLAARAVGRGRVIVSLLKQTESPDSDAVGRGLLAEMILSGLQPPGPGALSKEHDRG